MKTPAESKPFYKSKTFWLNIVALLSLAVPAVREWLESNPIEFSSALAALNTLLRFVTKDKISLGWDTSGANGSNGGLPLALLCCVGLGLSGFALTSCSYLPAGLTGSVYYQDSNTGSKAGMKFEDGKGTARVFVPVFDENGKQVGKAEVEVPFSVIEATK